jgi:hypothetical protein
MKIFKKKLANEGAKKPKTNFGRNVQEQYESSIKESRSPISHQQMGIISNTFRSGGING